MAIALLNPLPGSTARSDAGNSGSIKRPRAISACQEANGLATGINTECLAGYVPRYGAEVLKSLAIGPADGTNSGRGVSVSDDIIQVVGSSSFAELSTSQHTEQYWLTARPKKCIGAGVRRRS